MASVAFVTTFCPHHRVQTFQILARYCDIQYTFFSAGGEWYWQAQHGVSQGDFRFIQVPGIQIGNTRVTPALLLELWQSQSDVFIKCINGRFALPITYVVARLRRKPFILWTGIWMRLQTPAHRLFFPLTRYIYRHADAVVVYGEHVKRYLVAEGVPPDRIFVAAHAVDNAAYALTVPAAAQAARRAALDVAPDQKVILYLGRLEEVKGLNYLLEAFAALQRTDAVLVFAGAGSAEARLRAAAEQMGIARQVRFAGYVPHTEAIQYYALAWASVLPSITLPTGKETWGLVVNEAFNQGVPVVATDAVGAAAGGLVQHGINGFVVPERNATAIADALRLLLDYPDLRARLSENARATIAQWDNERMVLGFRQAIAYVTGAEAPG